MASWSFASHIVVELLCSRLCLFEPIVELHTMEENNVRWIYKH